MSDHEVSRVVQAAPEAVFTLVADVERLPDWLPEAASASTLPDGEVHVEGVADQPSEGFWRAQEDQRRVEWSTPSRGGEPGDYAGWLQVEDSGSGSEVVVHLTFEGDGPPGVESRLASALDALADLVEA